MLSVTLEVGGKTKVFLFRVPLPDAGNVAAKAPVTELPCFDLTAVRGEERERGNIGDDSPGSRWKAVH
jgi:hypothetical protein